MIDSHEQSLIRKRKYSEIVEESEFKELDDVLQKHPIEFDKKTIDAIPLKNNSKTKDSFLKEINTNASIKEYAKSVLNPVSITLKQLMSEANKTREELGGLLFL